MLDKIAGRGAAAAAVAPADSKAPGKKPDDKKDAGKKKSVKANPKAGADAAAKDIKAPSVATISLVSPIMRVEVPLDEAVHVAIAREHQILHYRLEMIARNACMYFEELQPLITGARGRMDGLLMATSEAELKVVEEAIVYMMDSVAEQIPMWYKCFFGGDHFIIALAKLVKEPGPLVPKDTIEWHVQLLNSLGTRFKAAPKAYMVVEDAKSEVVKSIEEVHTLFKDDLSQGQVPRLPCNKEIPHGPFQVWYDKVDQVIQVSTKDMEEVAEGFKRVIEWRAFLVALADCQFDFFLSKSTLEDIVQARVDFFLVVATKSEDDPTDGFMTFNDFLETGVWFDTFVDDNSEEENTEAEGEAQDHEEPPPVEVTPQEPPEFDFGTETKKFIYGILDKGEPGLPWHTLLLYLCRDASQPLAIQKAFTILGAPMGPEEVELTVEELLCLVYPNGVQGALEAGLKAWDIHYLRMILENLAMEKARAASPLSDKSSLGDLVNNFPKPPPKKPWTGMECRELKRTKLLTENEFKVVMDEFLGGIKPDTPSSQISGISSQAALTISEFIGSIGGEPIEVPTRLSLEDLLTRNATKELREALFKIYTRLCVWPVSVEAALIVAAAPTKRPSRMSMKKK